MKHAQPLTPEEAAFAAEHHALVYEYLRENNLPEDEYYDVVVFGYITGVRKHFRFQDMRQSSFSALARKEMHTCYARYQQESSCMEQTPVLSLSECDKSAYALEETIADVCDTAEAAIHSILLEQTLASYDDTERRIAHLLMQGYPHEDIRKVLDLTIQQLQDCIHSMQIKTMQSPLMCSKKQTAA